jgi:tetratricopeptide (TPR) repeat protein
VAAEKSNKTANAIHGGNQFGPVFQGRDFDLTIHSSAAPPSSLGQLPPQTVGFTGRADELQTLTNYLDPASAGTVVVSALAGLAGVGKTALAVASCHAARAQGWYSGGVLFIDLHGYDESAVQPGQALDELLRALSIQSEHIPVGTDARSALYRSVLAQITEPILIVLDNASSEAQVQALLPGEGPHRVVVTSRHTLAGLEARLVDVAVLRRSASVQLLDTALRNARANDDRISNYEETADRIGQLCGGLPLALQIVASILKADPSRAPGALEADLTVEHERLDRLQYDDGSGRSTPSVAAAFGLSYKMLDELTARVFRLMSLNSGPEFATEAAAVLADLPVKEVREVLSSLARAHLLEPASAGRWRMHDLLRLYAHRLCNDDPLAEAARRRMFTYYSGRTTAAVLWLLVEPPDGFHNEFSDRKEAIEWLETERLNLVAAANGALENGDFDAAFDLSVGTVEYLTWQHNVDEWLATAAIGLQAARGLGDLEKEAGAINNLGLAYQAADRIEEAIEAHQAAIDIFRGMDQPTQLGMALHNIGMAYRAARQIDEALDAYTQDLAICRRVHDDYGEAITLGGIANCLQDKGNYPKAISTANRAISIWKRLGNRHREAMAQNILCSCLADAGRLDESIATGRTAVTVLQETGDRYEESKVLISLSAVLTQAGQYQEAMEVSEKAVSLTREVGDREGEARALNNLAGSVLNLNRPVDEAIDADRAALDIFKETGNRYHIGTGFNNLGLTLGRAGRLDEAIVAHESAVEILLDIGEQGRAAEAFNNLAVALGTSERFEESAAAASRAIKLFDETGDVDGRSRALNNLYTSIQQANGGDALIAHLEKVAREHQDEGDKQSEARSLLTLAPMLAHASRFDEAVSACRRALALCQDVNDRLGQAVAHNGLGMALQSSGNARDAIDSFQQAIAIFRGEGDKRQLALALIALKSAYQELEDFDQATQTESAAEAVLRDMGVPDTILQAALSRPSGLSLGDALRWGEQGTIAHGRRGRYTAPARVRQGEQRGRSDVSFRRRNQPRRTSRNQRRGRGRGRSG